VYLLLSDHTDSEGLCCSHLKSLEVYLYRSWALLHVLLTVLHDDIRSAYVSLELCLLDCVGNLTLDDFDLLVAVTKAICRSILPLLAKLGIVLGYNLSILLLLCNILSLGACW